MNHLIIFGIQCLLTVCFSFLCDCQLLNQMFSAFVFATTILTNLFSPSFYSSYGLSIGAAVISESYYFLFFIGVTYWIWISFNKTGHPLGELTPNDPTHKKAAPAATGLVGTLPKAQNGRTVGFWLYVLISCVILCFNLKNSLALHNLDFLIYGKNLTFALSFVEVVGFVLVLWACSRITDKKAFLALQCLSLIVICLICFFLSLGGFLTLAPLTVSIAFIGATLLGCMINTFNAVGQTCIQVVLFLPTIQHRQIGMQELEKEYSLSLYFFIAYTKFVTGFYYVFSDWLTSNLSEVFRDWPFFDLTVQFFVGAVVSFWFFLAFRLGVCAKRLLSASEISKVQIPSEILLLFDLYFASIWKVLYWCWSESVSCHGLTWRALCSTLLLSPVTTCNAESTSGAIKSALIFIPSAKESFWKGAALTLSVFGSAGLVATLGDMYSNVIFSAHVKELETGVESIKTIGKANPNNGSVQTLGSQIRKSILLANGSHNPISERVQESAKATGDMLDLVILMGDCKKPTVNLKGVLDCLKSIADSSK